MRASEITLPPIAPQFSTRLSNIFRRVTSASLATQFTLPTAGQYTIGVFRISLVEPAAVEPTVFQLEVTTAE